MDRKTKRQLTDKKAAPTSNEEDSYGENATKSEIEQGESTKVTRLVYDEYDSSRPE
ncbi:hypothetical protein [Thalassobacillus pellis]|uniref:hypothetical protein n=1 Tax=Thalassobacillus pellis TaxID=748008 RepID=UPI0019613D5A|nr:hypothetical protein [Thalassobacillus pellis]MBM7553549.1 hypothetical protein [Thalassobacillus pellis]